MASSRGTALADAPPARSTLDVPYRTVDGVTLKLDVYQPAAPGPYPAVVIIHGGGWRSGDKKDWSAEGNRAAGSGFVAYVINYRLACKVGALCGFHALSPVEDARAAIAWVRQNAAQFDTDPRRVSVLGGSAGGNIASMTGLTGTPGVDRADAVASWSGAQHLEVCTSDPTCPDPTRVNYVGCPYDQCKPRWDAASPFHNVASEDAHAPFYLANSDDELVDEKEAIDMCAALTAVGSVCSLRILPGKRHSRAYEDAVWDETFAFLDSHMGQGGSIFDSFDRADSDSMGHADTGQPWTALTGSWGVESDRARAAIGPTIDAKAVIDAGVPDGTLASDITLSPTPNRAEARVLFRVQDPKDFLWLRLPIRDSGVTNGLYLYKRVGGVDTLLATTDYQKLVNGATYHIVVNLAGERVQIFRDELLRLTYTITDPILLGGTQVGMGTTQTQTDFDDGGTRFDNFTFSPS